MDNASALRRQLLAELRHLRPPHVMTQKQIADALDWSPSKVTRIENGSVSASVEPRGCWVSRSVSTGAGSGDAALTADLWDRMVVVFQWPRARSSRASGRG